MRRAMNDSLKPWGRRFTPLAYVLLVTLLAMTMLLCVCLGSVRIPLSVSLQLIWHRLRRLPLPDSSWKNIVLNIRLPRVLCVALSGASPSPFALKKILEALNSDMPKLAGLDVSGVVLGDSANVPGAEEAEAADAGRESSMFAPAVKRRMPRKHAKAAAPELPVCGILTTPYPCLVMKNGARLLEGATVGGSVILKIEADSVTVTNSMGRFTVRP